MWVKRQLICEGNLIEHINVDIQLKNWLPCPFHNHNYIKGGLLSTLLMQHKSSCTNTVVEREHEYEHE